MAVIYTKGLSTHSRSWADLDLDFTKHPVTKDIVKKTNIEAVKRAVRNIVLTNRYDKPFHPEIDGGVTRHYLDCLQHTLNMILLLQFNLV